MDIAEELVQVVELDSVIRNFELDLVCKFVVVDAEVIERVFVVE